MNPHLHIIHRNITTFKSNLSFNQTDLYLKLNLLPTQLSYKFLSLLFFTTAVISTSNKTWGLLCPCLQFHNHPSWPLLITCKISTETFICFCVISNKYIIYWLYIIFYGSKLNVFQKDLFFFIPPGCHQWHFRSSPSISRTTAQPASCSHLWVPVCCLLKSQWTCGCELQVANLWLCSVDQESTICAPWSRTPICLFFFII